MAQAPGQKGAIIPSSSEPRRVDTKPLTTDAPLPWGTRLARREVGLEQARRSIPISLRRFSPPSAMPPGELCTILIRIQSACLASISPAEARSMSRSKRVALPALAFLVMISAWLPGRADDDRPIAEVMQALRPDHPRLYVLDEEIDTIKQQIKVDGACGASMTGCKKTRRKCSRSRWSSIG